MFILLFKDNTVIFKKNSRLINFGLYLLTTPIPLILILTYPSLKGFLKEKMFLYNDVSEYKMCENCINEGDSLKIIYCSGGPNFNNNYEYYYHYIGIRKINDDTLNILTTGLVPLSNSRYNYQFINEKNNFFRRLNSAEETLGTSFNIEELQKIKLKEIKK